MENTEIAAAKIQASARGLTWEIPAAIVRTTAGRQGIKYRARKIGRKAETARTVAKGTMSQEKIRAYPQPCRVRPLLRQAREAANTASDTATASSARSRIPTFPASMRKKSSTARAFVGG